MKLVSSFSNVDCPQTLANLGALPFKTCGIICDLFPTFALFLTGLADQFLTRSSVNAREVQSKTCSGTILE